MSSTAPHVPHPSARADHGPEVATLMERVLYEVKRVVVGQDRFLERVLVAILAQGHLLVEGVPGLAKTLTVKTLARTIRGTFKRIQFTPDLVPADLVGTRIYNQKTGDFNTSLAIGDLSATYIRAGRYLFLTKGNNGKRSLKY